RTARLDLDNINNDTEDGLHITSMAGSWLSIVQGFAGMRVTDGELSFAPFLPDGWENYRFKINFRDRLLEVKVEVGKVTVKLCHGEPIHLEMYKNEYLLETAIKVEF
ncbi:glycoside hydrolase family 65 protein, partial [Neisseria meningitidis]|nr:glycoside hydrolase family 65 protein [Neisseria meningitidis]